MKHVFALDLSGNELTDEDVRLIVDSRVSLRFLSLTDNPITLLAAEEMAAATAAGHFPELHTFYSDLNIYDSLEGGGYAMDPIATLVERPPAGLHLREKYGELPWLTPTQRGGMLYA
jgi:hypothetical protein